MDYYQLGATVSLVGQIVVLILLAPGFWLKSMKKFRQHGITMLMAVALHTAIILAWMMPSFSSLIGSLSSINLANTITVTIFFHAFTGIPAAILGIWLVASWRLQANLKSCFAKKSVMRVTIITWLITLVLGIILYLKIIQLV